MSGLGGWGDGGAGAARVVGRHIPFGLRGEAIDCGDAE